MKIKRYSLDYFLIDVGGWRDRLAILELRYQRGNGIINIGKDQLMIVGYGTLVSGILLEVPFYLYPIFGITWFIGCYTLGFLDEKFGYWKTKEKYNSGQINPFFKEIGEDIKQIKNKLDI